MQRMTYREQISGMDRIGRSRSSQVVNLMLSTLCFLLLASCDRDPTGSRSSKELDEIATLVEKGNNQTALLKLQEYTQRYPKEGLAWTILGRVNLDLDRLRDAERAYHKALELDPENFQAITGMGILSRKQGQNDEAMKYYNRALQLRPDYAYAYSSMAVIALKQGHDKQALEYATKAYELEKTDKTVVANLAVSYHYNGMLELRDKTTAEAERLGSG